MYECCLVSPEALTAVTSALDSFRKRWNAIRPPFPAAFDATITDVHAIQYGAYESLWTMSCGLESAALICGEVVRKAAGYEWWINFRGDWVLMHPEPFSSHVAICPLARLLEMPNGYGIYTDFVQRAAFEIQLSLGSEDRPGLRDLLSGEHGDYVERVQRTIASFRSDESSSIARRTRRHRPSS